MGQLEGRIALVTGASRGIGAGCAVALAAEGASVLLVHRDSGAACDEVRAGLAGSGHRVIQADVTDSEALAGAAKDIAANEGRLDLLVNNAGWSKVIPPEDLDGLDDATFDKVMQTNVRGPFACVRAFKDLLLKGTEPSIVNISSVAAQLAAGSNIAYAASKSALDTLTVALARALAPNIRVFSVSPGLVDTDLGSHRASIGAFLAALNFGYYINASASLVNRRVRRRLDHCPAAFSRSLFDHWA